MLTVNQFTVNGDKNLVHGLPGIFERQFIASGVRTDIKESILF